MQSHRPGSTAQDDATAQGGLCKLALVLGLDISSSVNDREYRLQIEGLAYALETDVVIEAILSPPGATVAVIAYEWSGYSQQDLITGWTMLDSREAILAYAARLRAHQRIYSDFPTAIGKAVEYGATLFRTAPLCARQVIDLSGDGENNDGVGPEYFRQRGDLAGITINGLVILGAYPNPGIYYRTYVMQGPGAFVAIARDFEDYRSVMVGKLLREINTQMVVGSAPEAQDPSPGGQALPLAALPGTAEEQRRTAGILTGEGLMLSAERTGGRATPHLPPTEPDGATLPPGGPDLSTAAAAPPPAREDR